VGGKKRNKIWGSGTRKGRKKKGGRGKYPAAFTTSGRQKQWETGEKRDARETRYPGILDARLLPELG